MYACRHFHCYLGIWQLKDLKDAISSEELGEIRLVVTKILLAEDEAGMLASFSWERPGTPWMKAE